VSTTPLGEGGVGATEPSDPAYARIAISNDPNNFSTPANRISTITTAFLYPTSTVNWGNVTHFVVGDAGAGGNIWFYGELQYSRNVEIESSLVLEANFNQFMFDICGGSDTQMAMPTAQANRVLAHLFGQTPTLAPPPTYFLGVSSTPINSEGIGATEPSATEYARIAIPNDKNSFTAAIGRRISITQPFSMPVSTTEWGNFTHFFITDTPTGVGNIWWSGELTYSRNVEVSTTLSMIPSGWVWALDSCIPTVLPS
jgi:hypothetical protein